MEMAKATGAQAVDPNVIYGFTDGTFYALAALGATINDETIDRLKCAVIGRSKLIN